MEELEPTVYNYLVDSKYIESTLLIENDDHARHIMDPMVVLRAKLETIISLLKPPRNVYVAYTMTCSMVMPARGLVPYRFIAQPQLYRSRILTQNLGELVARIKQHERLISDKQIETHKVLNTK